MYIFILGKLENDWNCRSIMARLPLKGGDRKKFETRDFPVV